MTCSPYLSRRSRPSWIALRAPQRCSPAAPAAGSGERRPPRRTSRRSEQSSKPSSLQPAGADFDALLAVLDPDVTVRADGAAVPVGAPRTITGAPAVARQALTFSRRAPHARPALVNGTIGIAVEPRGRLTVVMTFRFSGDKITNIDVVADPERLHRLQLTADPAQRAD